LDPANLKSAAANAAGSAAAAAAATPSTAGSAAPEQAAATAAARFAEPAERFDRIVVNRSMLRDHYLSHYVTGLHKLELQMLEEAATV
jgi:hypothetical protein